MWREMVGPAKQKLNEDATELLKHWSWEENTVNEHGLASSTREETVMEMLKTVPKMWTFSSLLKILFSFTNSRSKFL